MSAKNILIVAGEPSGDLHASNLVRDLKKIKEGLSFFGLGGTLSKDAGVEIIFDISKLALIGVVEVVARAFTIRKAYKKLLRAIDLRRPDLAILVDYPGFNLTLARDLHKRSIPVVYYVSPQVWAWGRDRVKIIRKCVKKMVVFFKFEEELYKTYGIDAEWVGHPLLDVVKTTLSKDEVLKKYGLSKEKKLIALLPGSRELEVRSFLSTMAESAKIINEKLKDTQFIISKHPDLPLDIYKDAMRHAGIDLKIADGDTYNILGAADLAIVASGTATLETAILGTPLIIVYRVNLVTFLLYKIVRVGSYLGLVNIIAGREIAPELLQYDFTAEKVAIKTVGMLSDGKIMETAREELGRVRSSLGAAGARERAARAILPLI